MFVHRGTHTRTQQKRSLLGTGVLQVVDAVDQSTAAQATAAQSTSSHNQAPPSTDATPAPPTSQPDALVSTASLLPQLRNSLAEMGLTLPWPTHPHPPPPPHLPAAPPPREHEASSAPNTRAMLQHMAQLQQQGMELIHSCVDNEEPDTAARASSAAPAPSTSAMSADTQHTQRSRRTRTPQRSTSKRSQKATSESVQLRAAVNARISQLHDLQRQWQALCDAA